MLRSDFDNHPLWDDFARVDSQLQSIVDEHEPNELPYVERIKMQMSYVRGFDVVASTRAAFFHPQMLQPVQSVWEQVEGSLATRIANGVAHTAYLQTASDQAESGLLQMAAWPRPYGRGGEVKQMDTLFEQLLEHQRISIEALNAEHARLRNEIVEYDEQVESKRDEVNTELSGVSTKLVELSTTIEEQKSELATAIDEAGTAVQALTTKNSTAYKEWRQAREADFNTDFDPLRAQIADKLASADAEYDELLGAKEKYTKLVSAIAADEVAAQFESEAEWGRRLGNRYYFVGFALLLVAAIPLVWLLFDQSKTSAGTINWTVIISRLAIGVVAGSAATVAIRLGSRLIGNANAVKRMELELRAIGPFLANVSEKQMVDGAFVDLISKAFGNTYAETGSTNGKDSADDKVSVTAVAQLLELLDKTRKVLPPTIGPS